jgi:UDP-N-acetylmuramate-alanine ligase
LRGALDSAWFTADEIAAVIHVAGTNGKGSTIAFMSAIAEAAGLKRARFHQAAPLSAERTLRRIKPLCG